MYDREARLWKERGRGELRLNDSPQSEGVYQSRLVMRATGSYRVLLNTNVWNGMNCERASPQSLRITAQESGGQFGIYLIKVHVFLHVFMCDCGNGFIFLLSFFRVR